MSGLQKRASFKGYQHRQLKTKFDPIFFVLPRLRGRVYGQLFQLNSGRLTNLKTLAEANTTPAPKQIAVGSTSAWPYRLAQQSIRPLIGVSISLQQIHQLCWQEAVRVKTQGQTDFPAGWVMIIGSVVEQAVDLLVCC